MTSKLENLYRLLKQCDETIDALRWKVFNFGVDPTKSIDERCDDALHGIFPEDDDVEDISDDDFRLLMCPDADCSNLGMRVEPGGLYDLCCQVKQERQYRETILIEIAREKANTQGAAL